MTPLDSPPSPAAPENAVALTNTLRESSLNEVRKAVVGQDEALYQQLSDEAGWKLSPVLSQATPWNRVGIRFDGSGAVDMEARVSTDGGARFGPFRPVEVTFTEGVARNAHLDVPSGASQKISS